MYVIGSTETSHIWNSVEWYDGESSVISIGMMANYGENAKDLLSRFPSGDPDGWARIQAAAPTLASQVLDPSLGWNWWASRVLDATEHVALENELGTEDGIAIQVAMWNDQCGAYIDEALARGMSLDRPKEIIYFCSMRHQYPASAQAVMSAVGGLATLSLIHTTRANDRVLSRYPNRYNITYNMLLEWDGVSEPPDFGQNSFNDAPPNRWGDRPANNEPIPDNFSYINQVGNNLFVYGKAPFDRGVMFIPSGMQTWIPAKNAFGTTIGGGWSGGGSLAPTDPGRDALRAAIVQKMRDLEGSLRYSQDWGRLTPDVSGYSDCSALVWWLYHAIAGIEVGTFTTDSLNYGWMVQEGNYTNDINVDVMLPGDMICIKYGTWSGGQVVIRRNDGWTFDHTSLYMGIGNGNGESWGHGGPGYGPHLESNDTRHRPSAGSNAPWYYFQVRRFIQP